MRVDVGLDALADPDFRAAAGDDVQGGEILRDADRVVVRQQGDAGGQPDAFGLASDPGEEDLRDGHDEAGEMMLVADQRVEAERFDGQQIFHDMGVPLILRRPDSGHRIGPVIAQTAQPDLHDPLSCLANRIIRGN